MATRYATTGNQSIRGTMSDQIPNKTSCLIPMNSNLRRLSTFRGWKSNVKSNIAAPVLAQAGFTYTGKNDLVICVLCKVEIDSWTIEMDPFVEHVQRSPSCPFVSEQSTLFQKRELSNSIFIKSPVERMDIPNWDDRSDCDTGGGKSTSNDRSQINFLQLFSTESVDTARTSTLSNWPSITPSARDMVAAGWWYTNIADRVICVHCDAMFHNWTEADRPYEIHRLKSPKCIFVRTTEIKNSGNREAPLVANSTLTEAINGETIVGAMNAAYAQVCNRHRSFESWPETEQASLPSIDSFVDAGFFYTGDQTIVKCFYCNGALRNWQATDDPKVEHARWFPQCAYIRQFIGENLYQAIQRKSRELRAAQQNSREPTNGTNGQSPNAWTSDELDRMVKARLDLPVVEKLRQENYSMAIIRKVFEMQLRFKKDDFKNDVDLRVACLILDKQVKLINGNEANLLVPQVWIKAYLVNQQGPQPQQIESQPQQPLTTVERPQAERVPSPRSPTNAARPRIAPTSEETFPCVLCLTTERQVACLPCGHLTCCVACGHSLRTCPLCRASVKAFVRIYT